MADAAAAVAAPEAAPPDLAALKRMFEEHQSLTAGARKESRTDDDYYHGKQLTPGQRRNLSRRRQPDGIYNRVRLGINGTLGVIEQSATDPRAYPRNPADEQSADVASKTLRFIADKSNFDALRLDAGWDYLVPGTCAVIVEADNDQIPLTQIRWEEFFYDPYARRPDFSDARYMGIAKWKYADELAAAYPDHAAAIQAAVQGGVTAVFGVDDTFSDRPREGSTAVAWVDGRRRRVMVVELYHREGGIWRRCIYFQGGVLAYGPSPYLDERKNPICPIEAQSCYVDGENNRYGCVRDMRAPQDEYNKRRQKLLHLVNTRQVQETAPGSALGVDADLARTEAARPDGVIPTGFQIVPTADLARGQSELLAHAGAEIERMSPNPALLGRQGENQSGRGQLVRQQAGMTEQAVTFSGLKEWELRVYRQMWNRARQFWQAPMWVRVTDDMGAPQFVGVNQFDVTADPITGQPVRIPRNDPKTGEPLAPNALAELDVDIIIDTTPDTANVQQEQFQQLAELGKMYGPQEVPFDDLLELSSFQNKAALLEKRKARREQMQQMQAQQAQLAQRGATAKIAKDEADAQLSGAKAAGEQLETMQAAQAWQSGLIPPPPAMPPPAAGV